LTVLNARPDYTTGAFSALGLAIFY